MMQESLDYKLFVLLLLRRFYVFVIGSLLGALLVGGIYYLTQVTFAAEKSYVAIAKYYVDYALDPNTTGQYTYINSATWNSLADSDFLLDIVSEDLETKLSKEELVEAISIDFPTDPRYIEVSATTTDPELSKELAVIMADAFLHLANTQKEVQEITLIDVGEATEDRVFEVRTQSAAILGAILGLLVSIIWWGIQYLLDDGIYVPRQLEQRHELLCLGSNHSVELNQNLKRLLESNKKVAILSVGSEVDPNTVCKQLDTKDLVVFPCMANSPESANELREYDACILVVQAVKDKSSKIESVLSFYRQQGVEIKAAILWDMKEWLFVKLGG